MHIHCIFYFRREGYEPELGAVSTGSHVDAIPHSGKYDGVVGVLGAIEAINVLKRYAIVSLSYIYRRIMGTVCTLVLNVH